MAFISISIYKVFSVLFNIFISVLPYKVLIKKNAVMMYLILLYKIMSNTHLTNLSMDKKKD